MAEGLGRAIASPGAGPHAVGLHRNRPGRRFLCTRSMSRAGLPHSRGAGCSLRRSASCPLRPRKTSLTVSLRPSVW